MDFQAFFLILATLSLDYLVATASVPALFAFGDSLVDAGDNEHLNTQARANHPPYGIDFENHQQGAQTLPQQVDDFQSMASQLQQQLGSNESSSLVSQSIFYICIGNNDVNNEFEQRKNLSTDFLQSVLDGVMEQMHRLYEMGARKFVVVGLSAVGCIPLNVQRDGSCAPVAQAAASSYNTMLRSALDEMSSTHQGIHIVLTNFYDLMVDTNTNPQQFGKKKIDES
ncbi:GDSL esterase/lipase At4g28780 [Selaginella moellendorffii]|uniref:GDSL esterase/lipase At4g28780 n=1 Tax=Selaginella moellendorffii TaxID=88036 RepID=UPI000D1D0844|nr:GDSL esterase/lipase At4g28780 [Selaginella moellendorffii]|eukprot:XP_024542458.1 GDSL esterase/lipase At4g28780 [Selaginella moellendorffii]